MIGEVKIPFAFFNGQIVSIDAALRGLACDCFCLSCSAPLIACKGDKNQHHFRHYVESESCVDARETAIHKFAKDLICKSGHEPSIPITDDMPVVFVGTMRSAEAEKWLDGIRPDILAEFDEQIAIEIRVTHPVPQEKIETFIRRKLPAFEIDLRTARQYHRGEEEWRHFILRTAPRFWLFEPRKIRDERDRQAENIKRAREWREATERQERELEAMRLAEFQRREKEAQQHDKEARAFLQRREIERQRQRQEAQKAEREDREYRERLKTIQARINADPWIQVLQHSADTKFHLGWWERRKRNGTVSGPDTLD